MAKTQEVVRQSNLSEERLYDSSDKEEDSIERDALKSRSGRPPIKSPNGVKPPSQKFKQKLPTLEIESSSQSAPASEVDDTAETEGVESEEDTDGTESEDNSDNDSAASPISTQKRRSPDQPETSSRKKAKIATPSKVRIPAKPFTAPKGYEPIALSASDYASDMTLFGDLSNKQIWHISVPDTVSIESIKELDIEAVLRGQPILSNKGLEYSMHAMPPKKEMILLPHGVETNYKQTERKVDRSFQMREVSTESKDTLTREVPLVFTATKTGAPKAVRKQPEGLKMRYVPYGAPSLPRQTQSEDVEMHDDFQIPAEVKVVPSSPATPRKADSQQTNGSQVSEKGPEKKVPGADTPGSSEKKSKKKKKRRLVDEDVL